MGMQAAIRDDDRTLRRIAATLIALAVLAERAGGLSHPVRFLVLCFLRPAEAVAREFVAGLAHAERLAGAAAIGNDPEHAVRLAMRLRALAAALGALLRLACRSACPNARIDGVARRLARHPGQLAAGGSKQRPDDTS
jgi:hypothetical protein